MSEHSIMTDSSGKTFRDSVAEGSITHFLARAKDGDEQAAAALWEAYFQRLTRIARRKLQGAPTRAADEEDVVVEAFTRLFRGMEANRFRQLESRDDLWPVLVMLTVRKAVDQRLHEQAQKRGGGNVRGESAFVGTSDDELATGISEFLADERTPAFTVEMEEGCQQLFGVLDDSLRQIALWRLEGYSNAEVAERTGKDISWVERQFRKIRDRWSVIVSV
jgi:DNA-directed RNA polymerase specialized sigma24 family protein